MGSWRSGRAASSTAGKFNLDGAVAANQIIATLSPRSLARPRLATAGCEAISSILFGLGALDPLTYLVVFAPVTVSSLFSVYVPAQRETRMRPMEALGAE